MTDSPSDDEARDLAERLRGFDTAVPSPARMWNYWVGGKDNFAADREAADRVQAAMPALPEIARSGARLPRLASQPAPVNWALAS